MSDFGGLTHPVARHPHLCAWCERAIEKGAKHANYRGRWNDEWQNWRMHEDCFTCYEMHEDYYDEGFSIGDGRQCDDCCRMHP